MPVLSQPDTVIPNYSLQQISGKANTMIEVAESGGDSVRRQSNFLVPHRRNYYLMVFVKNGSSRHWVDCTPYTLKPNTFYFTVPHQVHLKEEAEPLHGLMACFTEEFLQLEENNMLRQLPIIQNADSAHELNLQAHDVVFIEDTMQKMLNEFKTGHDWRNQMLQAYLRVLMIYLSRLYTEQYTDKALVPDRVILKKFQSLIEDNFREKHEVAEYAGMLNITPGYLNDLVKQQGGKTAITHIHERLVVEAKRLLLHTELSIKQLAYEIGFDDAAYFNRFFKRLTNSTPAAYRTNIRQMYS